MYRLCFSAGDQLSYLLTALLTAGKFDVLSGGEMYVYRLPVVVFPAELVGRSDVNDSSLIEQRDGIAELVRFFHVVCGKEDRASFFFLIKDYPVDRF